MESLEKHWAGWARSWTEWARAETLRARTRGTARRHPCKQDWIEALGETIWDWWTRLCVTIYYDHLPLLGFLPLLGVRWGEGGRLPLSIRGSPLPSPGYQSGWDFFSFSPRPFLRESWRHFLLLPSSLPLSGVFSPLEGILAIQLCKLLDFQSPALTLTAILFTVKFYRYWQASLTQENNSPSFAP